ncbi:MAG: diadenylate cyclase [Candidatus Hodarchaeaceae archaeon]|nr:diadenylate cyclase [Candidatus Hodarchaeaceae archaeon]
MDVPKMLAETAVRLALDVNADAILALTETGKNCEPLISKKFVGRHGKEIKVIVATPSIEACRKFSKNTSVRLIKLTARPASRVTQAHHAMTCGLREGILSPGERLVCLAGNGFADITDSIMVLDVTEDQLAMGALESDPILASTVELSIELGKGGPDRKPVGTAFTIGESRAVMRLSRQLMINPFKSYRANVSDRSCWDLLKKYAALDGAFVVEKDGLIVAAHRYLNANVKVAIPKGLGARHLAVASMTAATKSKGVTVSGEDGVVRIFEGGRLVAKVDPNSKIIECLRGSIEINNFRSYR